MVDNRYKNESIVTPTNRNDKILVLETLNRYLTNTNIILVHL